MKYIVTGKVEASKIIGVFDAASIKDAEKQATESKNNIVELCHMCNDECLGAKVVSFTIEEC